MKQTSEIGMNKTGMQMAPVMGKEMLEATTQVTPEAQGHDELMSGIERFRREYIQQSDPVGTVPMPGSLKGAVSSGAQMLKGKDPVNFIDKLGERLAFERTGTRLYDAFIEKCRVQAPEADISRLEAIRSEEAQHFSIIRESIEMLGADPTAQTPAADNVGVQGMGLLQVVTDPRTTIEQCVQAIHAAELIDVDGWDLLIKMAEEAGQTAMVQRFKAASENEKMHLEHIRRFHEELLLSKTETLQ